MFLGTYWRSLLASEILIFWAVSNQRNLRGSIAFERSFLTVKAESLVHVHEMIVGCCQCARDLSSG